MVLALVIFGLLASFWSVSRRTQERSPFHPKQTLFCGVTFLRAHPLPTTPFQCPRSRTAPLGWGAAAPFLTLRWPDCTLSRLRAEEYDRSVTQSIATDPHPRSDAGRPPEPWVCHHTREPTVLSRVSCRPSHLNVDRFHQPCLLPWRNSLLPPKHGWLLGRDRWGLSVSPNNVATTYPCGLPGSPSFATHWRYCHADSTVPRQDVNSSFSSCVCHPLVKGVCTHTQVRDPRESAAACCRPALGTPSPWPSASRVHEHGGS